MGYLGTRVLGALPAVADGGEVAPNRVHIIHSKCNCSLFLFYASSLVLPDWTTDFMPRVFDQPWFST